MSGNVVIPEPVWSWDQPRTGGWSGLALLSVGAGIVTSITEVLGKSFRFDETGLFTVTLIHCSTWNRSGNLGR